MFEWNESFSVGNQAIDDQHKQLLALCNKCYGILSLGGSTARSQLHSLIDELGEYVRIHFDYEESVLRLYNYTKLAEHIAEHDAYWQKLSNIRNKAATEVDISNDVMVLINEWWEHHILENDAQYRQYLSFDKSP